MKNKENAVHRKIDYENTQISTMEKERKIKNLQKKKKTERNMHRTLKMTRFLRYVTMNQAVCVGIFL
jgi:hypothetical protein